MDPHPTYQKEKPQPSKTSFLSQLFFCWSLPLFYNRYKREVTEDESFQPLNSHKAGILGSKLEKHWLQETTKPNPSLWKALWRTFHLQFLVLALLIVSSEFILKMSQPWLIGKLMAQYTTSKSDNVYFYGCLLLVNNFLSVMVGHNYILHVQHLGMKVRISCCSLIYRKVLRLQKATLSDLSVGRMINLVSNDVNRFDMAPMHLLQLLVAPVETLFVIWCLYVTVGPTAIAGIVFLVLFVPLQMYMGKLTSRFRSRTASRTDRRIKLMNEIISGIQMIKMYTWEGLFTKLVTESRSSELRHITHLSYLRGLNASFMIFMNRTGIFLCILTYALTLDKMDAQYVFVVASFYAILRQALTVYLPFGINNLSETRVSVHRIESFLTQPEVKKEVTTSMEDEKDPLVKQNSAVILDQDTDSTVGVCLDGVSLKWPKAQNWVLQNVHLEAHQELVAITGPVGGGKSTLLHTILQELPPLSGTVGVRGSISYSSQEPWLFSGTIRRNILFGSRFDQERYRKVVAVCGLVEDFAQLPHGDGSEVGDRGVMLSGGQKARINLARAVYKEADIYLLDDPFAAVDTKVGKRIFQECMVDFLKDKCTILVTHHLRYLGKVAKIYAVSGGRVEELERGGDTDEEVVYTQEEAVLSEAKPALEVKEERKTGTISTQIYKKYAAAGGRTWVLVLFLLFILTQVGASGSDYFLGFWVNVGNGSTFFTHHHCIYIYVGLILFTILVSVVRSTAFFHFCMQASHHLHAQMLLRVVSAPMDFFTLNPSGRILNRFAKDMGLADETLPVVMMDTFQIAFIVVGSTSIVTLLHPWMVVATIVIFFLFYFFRRMFLVTSRNLKRLEAANRSPIYSHFNASLSGLTTIRAFKVEERLAEEFDRHQDRHSSSFYMFLTCNRAFGFWLDLACVFYVILVIIGVMFVDTSAGAAGLVITQSINLIGVFQWGIRQWSELENQMVSIERIVEYTDLLPEHSPDLVVQNWPSQGRIQFQSLSLHYPGHLVLKDLSFQIHPREKVGIVGRTGAGKSSLISALFRLAPTEGHILIDLVDTREISLNSLRSRISIIPQEPVLFSGTLRKNLDPFDEYSDEQLWDALDEVKLKAAVADLPSGLASVVSEGGANFSVGQRQLLCLARAVVRRNRILVLDEATANVDPQTDGLIQGTIREKFRDCTVLTIAHRLHTVMDSDRVLVMDGGKVVEFDHPHRLLQGDSVFAQLVKESGREMAVELATVAEKDYERKYKEE